jgi:hypothetical protein
MYVVKGLEIDSTNAQLKGIKEIFVQAADKRNSKAWRKNNW